MIISKTKKLLGLFTVLCMLTALVVPVSVSAAVAGDTFTDGDFTYTVLTDTSTVKLTSIAAASLSGDVTVPSTVTDGSANYTVTQLGDAFKNQGAKTNSMTSLVLPDTITKFTGTATFYGCKFTSVHLPVNLTGDATTGQLTNTFQQCTNLTYIEIPAGITKLYGTFRSSNCAVRNVVLLGTSQVDFYQESGTAGARAFYDSVTDANAHYPEGGTAPKRTTGYGTTITVSTYAGYIRDGIRYTVADGIATATECRRNNGVHTLLSEVEGYPVTKLAGACFQNKTGVTKVIMPDSIVTMGANTFQGCTSLTSVRLSANLTSGNGTAGSGIMQMTFINASSMTSVVIPAGIKTFIRPFSNTNKGFKTNYIKTIVLTSSTSASGFYQDSGSAEYRAFADNSTGIRIYVPAGSTVKRYSGNGTTPTICYYDDTYSWTESGANATILGTAYTGDMDGSKVTLSGAVSVPSTLNGKSVTAIGSQAFNAQADVTSLTLPDTVTSIGYQAFMEMDGLTSFTMPDSVTTIGYGTFYGCNNLESVHLSTALTGTLQTTFQYCPSLTACVIPSGVTTLNRTFGVNCFGLRTVVIPASVTSITGDTETQKLFTESAAAEDGFTVIGESGSAIDTYMTERGLDANFKAVDFTKDLSVAYPSVMGDDNLTVVIANHNKADFSNANLKAICAIYNTSGELQSISIQSVDGNGVGALGTKSVDFDNSVKYAEGTNPAKIFVWNITSRAPFADVSAKN